MNATMPKPPDESFELFGPPVHSVGHRWRGPTSRDSVCVADVGKVKDWR